MPTPRNPADAVVRRAMAAHDRNPDPILVACRAARLTARTSVAQAARDMGVSEGTIKGWENGNKRPAVNEARRYATYLGVAITTRITTRRPVLERRPTPPPPTDKDDNHVRKTTPRGAE